VLNIDKDRLEDAPGFDPDNWPDMADETWANEIHSYYGTTRSINQNSGYSSTRTNL
jgi:hypothetical protein